MPNHPGKSDSRFVAGAIWMCLMWGGVLFLYILSNVIEETALRFVPLIVMYVWVFLYVRSERIALFFVKRELKRKVKKRTPPVDKKLIKLLAATKTHRINADWVAFGNFNSEDIAKLLDALMAYVRWKAGEEKRR